jgi:hypothetical protein
MWLINGYTGAAAIDNVYSSSDGITWATVTASGPSGNSYAGQAIVFPTATTISTYNYETMYWLGGLDGASAAQNIIYYATLNTSLASTGISISPPIQSQRFQFGVFAEGRKLLLKNQSGLWVLDGGVLIPISDIGYPVETVPGLVVLGRFAYIMDPSGLIRNCDLADIYHWPMLNAVAADYEDDRGIAIAKYLNYLVVFGQYTIQFFYDAGNPVGSPLLPYLAGSMKVGCEHANTVVDIGHTVVWLGRTREMIRQVMMFNGLTPQVISTPEIEKIISGWTTAPSAYSFIANGHKFYVIYVASKPALAFDFSTQQWFEWTAAGSLTNPLAFIGSSSNLSTPSYSVVLHPTNGFLYFVDSTYLNDDGTAFNVLLITDKVDAGNNRLKFWGQTEIIGDRNTGTPTISTADDDYQTYSTGRTVDMTTPRPVLYRNGASRRRAWKYEQTDSNAMRLEAIEVTFENGM